MTALALALAGCSKTPWVGRYHRDMSGGIERAVALIKRDAEERGTRPPDLETKDQGLVLELMEDGAFVLTQQMLGGRTVTTGTYKVAGDSISLTMVECDGKPLGEEVLVGGMLRKDELKMDNWGTFRR